MLGERLYRIARRVVQTGLLQFHGLIGAVTDVELVIEPLAAVNFTVVARDQLAYMCGQQGLRGLFVGNANGRRAYHNSPPVLDGAVQPELRVLVCVVGAFHRFPRNRDKALHRFPRL